MLDVSELKPDDVVVNVSTLGAPSAKDVHLTAEHWMTALKNFELNYGKKIAGFTSCENGSHFHRQRLGYLRSYRHSPGGRAQQRTRSSHRNHGKHWTEPAAGLSDYPVCLWRRGRPLRGNRGKGSPELHSHVIRQSAVADGGMVGVLRNPVTAEYLAKNAAVGAISQALDIGKAFSQCKNGAEFVAFLEKNYDAKILAKGKIANYDLKMDGGYDIGHLDVNRRGGQRKLHLLE